MSAPSKGSVSRRAILSSPLILAFPLVANAAVDACPKGANNCVEGAWTAPAGMKGSEASASLKSVLDAYPQEGQAGVDEGGWKYAVEDLAGKGYARLEVSSSGKGNFAKFLNGGKPFVDDLEVSLEDGVAKFRSKSRTGDSDFGVNGKRVAYISTGLKAKGWAGP
eukprot:CAMPEP_0172616938 /NCGR_PEP_ID=MMETSP1068-20121228/68937_1 /TAXON_ID=35684 /ORGANISM="Pseudopedinella elastica, Strain CCMP716" /LENGTH=164 /DNA_ID=CAMNT_0013422569 /DNA_START=92 /DNA_END=586 /DNA_ORIENTATION=+